MGRWSICLPAIKASSGAVIWLFIPTAMLALSTDSHEDPIVPTVISVMGSILFIPVVTWLPLLQTHQAVTGRLRDIFDVRTVQKIIAQIPLHWAIATILLYAAVIPLYLTNAAVADCKLVDKIALHRPHD